MTIQTDAMVGGNKIVKELSGYLRMGEIMGGCPNLVDKHVMTPAGYKKSRCASWRTERRSVVSPGR